MKRIEIKVGDKYGILTVLEDRIAGMYYINCQCECGTIKGITINHLLKGKIISCGCLRGKTIKHGEAINSRTVEYQAWCDMRKRCKSHPKYLAKSITVCERWQTFENFLTDMGRKPIGDYSLERINNAGNYEPDNCKWATRLEQNRNKDNVKQNDTNINSYSG